MVEKFPARIACDYYEYALLFVSVRHGDESDAGRGLPAPERVVELDRLREATALGGEEELGQVVAHVAGAVVRVTLPVRTLSTTCSCLFYEQIVI